MKKIIFIFFIFITTNCYADILKIPFSCWPRDLQKEFSKKGIKLDLRGQDRNKNSWGYVVNNGDNYEIYTYHSVKKEEFQIIQDIVFKVEMKHK